MNVNNPFCVVRAIVLLLMLVNAGAAFSGPHNQLNPAQQSNLDQLRSSSRKAVKYNLDPRTGAPSHISLSVPVDVSVGYEQAALRFLSSHKALFLMKNPESELRHTRTKTDSRGIRHVRLRQVFQNIPVIGKELLVHIDAAGNVIRVNGKYLPGINVSVVPSVSSEKAVAAANADLASPSAKVVPAPELVIFDPQVYSVPSLEKHLSWKLTVASAKPLGHWVYFVDAHSGMVLFKYNNLKDARNRNTYTLNNLDCCLPGDLLITEVGPVPGITPDAITQKAHDNMGVTYNYFFSTFGRDGFDGSGATITTTVHAGSNYTNAYWDDILMQFVFGDGDASKNVGPLGNALDVVAHEFTHGVTQYEANLDYNNQSGALNESFSDVFGAMVDRDDWILGEDVPINGLYIQGLNRDLQNPPALGQPDHYFDYYYTASDNGGVHTNSGIVNKIASLIADGGTHNGFVVVGVGRGVTEKLYYNVLANVLDGFSTFSDLYYGMKDIATTHEDFSGNAAVALAVEQAFNSVGLGEDSDGDGLIDVLETNLGVYDPAQKKRTTGTDPAKQDTDNDTLLDGEEVLYLGTDPTVPTPGIGIWANPQMVSGNAIVMDPSAPPKITIDSGGNGIAIWLTTTTEVWAGRYVPGAGWTSVQKIGGGSNTPASYPRIAADASGNAMVVWSQVDGTRSNIWANRYDKTVNAWGTAQLIETNNTEDAHSRGVGMDQYGNAIATWQQQVNGSNYTIWTNRYSASTMTWGTPLRMDTSSAGDAFIPHVSVNQSGNAVVVWSQGNTGTEVWSSRYTAGAGWSTPLRVPRPLTGGNSVLPLVVMDNNNNAIAYWLQFPADGSTPGYWASRYNAVLAQWETSVLLESRAPCPYCTEWMPEVVVDANGNAMAIGEKVNDEGLFSVWVRRYNVTSGWESSQILSNLVLPLHARHPSVSMTPNGNVLAVWAQVDLNITTADIWSARYIPSTGWGIARRMESTAGRAFLPDVALSPQGKAISVWAHYSGTEGSIWANTADVDMIAPTVKITSPLGNATRKGTIDIIATASDNVGALRADFTATCGAGVPTFTSADFSAPFSVAWDTTKSPDGGCFLSALVYDVAGNRGADVVYMIVDNTPPTVTLTSPLHNAVVKDSINVAATATDNIGVVKVDFVVCPAGTVITATSAPYSVTWDTTKAANGPCVISALAYDTAGSIGIGQTTVTVDNTAPSAATTAFAVDVTAVSSNVISWKPKATSASGKPVTCRIGAPPANGTVTIDPSCSSGTYQSNNGLIGIDRFTYLANDGTADSNPGMVTVAVTEPPPSDLCLAQYPVSQFTQPGKLGTLTVTFTGNITAHTTKEVKLCPGTQLKYTAVSSRGPVVCRVMNNMTRGSGTLKINDYLKCSDNPAGKDKVHVKVKSGVR